MKKTFRFLSAVLCIAMIAALFAAIPAFAEGKPGPDDLKDAGKYVCGPKKEDSWLDEYKTAYIYAGGYRTGVYTYSSSRGQGHLRSAATSTEVTLLALENGRYLVKTDEGRFFWVYESCISDHIVAPGRALTDNAELDANGPSFNDVKKYDIEMDRPSPKDWLDEAKECYVYAPIHNYGTPMLYYYGDPTSKEAKEKGYDGTRSFGSIAQGKPITLLAHHGCRYFAVTEAGFAFWIYDWCVSDTQVPYGEAK